MSAPVTLHSVSDFLHQLVAPQAPSYWYEGTCPQTGQLLKLPRTTEMEAIARGLMQHLATLPTEEGKMYGVLLAATPSGERVVLKAFSGLLPGSSTVAGWVPPIPGREQIALAEAQTLEQLAAIKQELMQLQQLPERSHYATLSAEFATQLHHLKQQQQQRQQHRHQQRLQTSHLTGTALELALEAINQQSRQDGIERKLLKRQQDLALAPLRAVLDQSSDRIRQLKQQRKLLSRQLQAQLHASYWMTNFAGVSSPLSTIAAALPTGTGDCCAPKLLHYAATHQLKPLALAEFWWGQPSPNGDKVAGEFYAACTERCQPIMGFLLSGLGGEGLEMGGSVTNLSHKQLPIVALTKTNVYTPFVSTPSTSPLERGRTLVSPLSGVGVSPQLVSTPSNSPLARGRTLVSPLSGVGVSLQLVSTLSNSPFPRGRTLVSPLSKGGLRGVVQGLCTPHSDVYTQQLTRGDDNREGWMSGVETQQTVGALPILYADEWLIAVDKPSGLLSVPGRYHDRQDSVLSRLRFTLPNGDSLLPLHRLDQDTSGVLVIARDRQTYRHLSQQLQQRQVQKVYQAVLAGVISQPEGVIDLPLWGDPNNRPYQQVNWQQGKPSTTRFRVMERGRHSRVEFIPVTGRTHQIRVHAAAQQGLGVPILGDRWYGTAATGDRLHLHACQFSIHHPHSGKMLHLHSQPPF